MVVNPFFVEWLILDHQGFFFGQWCEGYLYFRFWLRCIDSNYNNMTVEMFMFTLCVSGLTTIFNLCFPMLFPWWVMRKNQPPFETNDHADCYIINGFSRNWDYYVFFTNYYSHVSWMRDVHYTVLNTIINFTILLFRMKTKSIKN